MQSYLRESDEKKADIVNSFLYDEFYSKYTTDYCYYNDLSTQVKGIDVSFVYNNKKYLCDEKAAVNWCNVPLETYAFEICSFNRGGKFQLGWLLNDDNKNDSYMLVWLNKTDKNELTSKGEIREADIMIMDKSKLRQHMDSIGWTKENLLAQAELMRNNPYMDTINIPKQNVQLRCSSQLIENPVNIRLKKSVLASMADCYYRIKA